MARCKARTRVRLHCFHHISIQNTAAELESPKAATSHSHNESSFARRAIQFHESNCPSLSTERRVVAARTEAEKESRLEEAQGQDYTLQPTDNPQRAPFLSFKVAVSDVAPFHNWSERPRQFVNQRSRFERRALCHPGRRITDPMMSRERVARASAISDQYPLRW